ncbi:sodium:solute symporter family protein [Thiohalophilus sp.]|uniref:sodium:solute symporter family protein n=1 Tax=Thiohalophilus sp. TaxID=3028392 RepID=UPI002ACDE799|nr:sodium:solute symporter family protein [Thiohalophilus sp.]MDZ7662693.1 sodium:solute symporter family protein [Thiohalophilus sp.]
MTAKTASDYFIAGRSISLWVFVLAATATSFSGWTFMGHPGLLYRDGFQYAYASFYAITIPFTGVLFLKRQWILGKRFGFVTPGEMFANYFKTDSIRLLVVLVALIFSVPYLGLQLRASGFLFNVLTDGMLGVEVGMWLLSAVVLIYVASGGLRAVAYVDTLQAIMLAVGIVAIGLIALNYVGGWDRLNDGIAALSQFDETRTPAGYSHYIAIPGVIQFVSGLGVENPVGGAWTAIMVLTYMFALMGIQSSPAFSMWAFSNHNPKPFAPQQVWASSFGIGIILMVFTAIQGLGGHFLGADTAFLAAHPELVNNAMAEGLHGVDLMDSEGKQGMLIPQYIYLLGEATPWFAGLLAVCALAAMQSTGAAYMSTAGGMLTRDLLKRYVLPNATHAQQKLWGRIGVAIIVLAALAVATTATDALVLLGGLAVAYGFQMWPALMAVCYFPWLTRQGVVLGLIAGLIAVTLTEKIGADLMPWGRWPWTIHSAGWGIIFNLGIAVIVSFFTQNKADHDHKMTYHSFLREHATIPAAKKKLVPTAWIITLVWFFFGIGPGAVIGNTIFGNPNDPSTWLFGMPSIWAWQILWWALGVFMMWFLAYKMEMSTVPKKEVEVLHEDIGDIHMDVDKP